MAWRDPDNDVTQLLDEGVSGGDLVIQVEVDSYQGVAGGIPDPKVNTAYKVPKNELESSVASN